MATDFLSGNNKGGNSARSNNQAATNNGQGQNQTNRSSRQWEGNSAGNTRGNSQQSGNNVGDAGARTTAAAA